jgi:hypothetical protein
MYQIFLSLWTVSNIILTQFVATDHQRTISFVIIYISYFILPFCCLWCFVVGSQPEVANHVLTMLRMVITRNCWWFQCRSAWGSRDPVGCGPQICFISQVRAEQHGLWTYRSPFSSCDSLVCGPEARILELANARNSSKIPVSDVRHFSWPMFTDTSAFSWPVFTDTSAFSWPVFTSAQGSSTTSFILIPRLAEVA